MEKDIINVKTTGLSEILDKLSYIQNKSIANKRKVGALIVDFSSLEILASGFNHNQYADKLTCENNDSETLDTVIHAEADCIMGLTHSTIDMSYIENLWSKNKPISMFVTFSPCIECSKLIVQYGKIRNLFIIEEHKKNFRTPIVSESLSALDFLLKNNIDIYFYKKESYTFEKYIKENDIENIIGVYHSADLDGFMSGLLMQQYLCKKENLFGYNFEKDAEWIKVVDNKSDNVTIYFGDISPSKDWLEKHVNEIKSGKIKLIILDHHINTLKYIENFMVKNNLGHEHINFQHTKLFNNLLDKYSGCEIIIKYLSKVLTPPIPAKLIILSKIIGSYDTWRYNELDFKYDIDTKNREYFLQLITYLMYNFHDKDSFVTFVDNLNNWQNEFDKFAGIGRMIENNDKSLFKHKLSKSIFAKYYNEKIHLDKPQYIILTENFYPKYFTLDCIKEYHKSIDKNLIENFDTNNYLYITYEMNLSKNEIKFSVRSYIGDFNNAPLQAIDIASQYPGGGGHNDAAGFITTINDGLKVIEWYNKLEKV